MSVELVEALTSELRIDGEDFDAAPRAVDWRLSLGVDRVTELAVTLDDPGLRLLSSGRLRRGRSVRWRDLDLRITAREIAPGPALEQLHLACRSAGVEELRRPGVGPRVWADIAPHELVAQEAEAVGLRFWGETTSPRRSQIVRAETTSAARSDGSLRAGVLAAGQTKAETTWGVMQRLAGELGYICFESGGTLVFARPSWLAETGLDEHARLWRWPPPARLAEDEDLLLAVPRCRESETTGERSVVGTVDVDEAVWYRPGEPVLFGGDVDDFAGLYIVARVEVDPSEPVAEVELVTPIDPEPRDTPNEPTGPEVSWSVPAPGGGPQLAAAPAGGEFGYQYDEGGSRCLGGPQPGARLLQDHLLATFAGTSNMGIYSCRANTANRSKLSVHAEGRAGDTGITPHGSANGDRVAAWLVANAPRLGVQYVIWNRRQWSARSRQWRSYGGPHPHHDHVHWELCWQAARHLRAEHLRAAA